MKYVILLSACVNPDGMSLTKLVDPNERMKQYINAINFYLDKTVFPIVFTENSNTDLSNKYEKQIRDGRLEYLTFSGNTNKKRGKGYGESEIINYSINHSVLIDSSCCIIKITGRLIIENINAVVISRKTFCLKQAIQCEVNSNFKFADSRIIIAPLDFFEHLLQRRELIDDSKNIFFEHILIDTIRNETDFYYFPYIIEPIIVGMSGSTGENYFIKKKSFNMSLSYLYYQLYLMQKFREYSLDKMNCAFVVLFKFVYYLVKLYCRLFRVC